jgi:hypothetical protein
VTTPATFPNALVAYLEVAVTRPLGPDAVAHRAVYYRVTQLEPGYTRHDTIAGAACQPPTSRTLATVDKNGNPEQETVPVTACATMSASWAQAHGAIRCTDPACYPLDDQPAPVAKKRTTTRTTKTAAKPAKKATKPGSGGAS